MKVYRIYFNEISEEEWLTAATYLLTNGYDYNRTDINLAGENSTNAGKEFVIRGMKAALKSDETVAIIGEMAHECRNENSAYFDFAIYREYSQNSKKFRICVVSGTRENDTFKIRSNRAYNCEKSGMSMPYLMFKEHSSQIIKGVPAIIRVIEAKVRYEFGISTCMDSSYKEACSYISEISKNVFPHSPSIQRLFQIYDIDKLNAELKDIINNRKDYFQPVVDKENHNYCVQPKSEDTKNFYKEDAKLVVYENLIGISMPQFISRQDPPPQFLNETHHFHFTALCVKCCKRMEDLKGYLNKNGHHIADCIIEITCCTDGKRDHRIYWSRIGKIFCGNVSKNFKTFQHVNPEHESPYLKAIEPLTEKDGLRILNFISESVMSDDIQCLRFNESLLSLHTGTEKTKLANLYFPTIDSDIDIFRKRMNGGHYEITFSKFTHYGERLWNSFNHSNMARKEYIKQHVEIHNADNLAKDSIIDIAEYPKKVEVSFEAKNPFNTLCEKLKINKDDFIDQMDKNCDLQQEKYDCGKFLRVVTLEFPQFSTVDDDNNIRGTLTIPNIAVIDVDAIPEDEVCKYYRNRTEYIENLVGPVKGHIEYYATTADSLNKYAIWFALNKFDGASVWNLEDRPWHLINEFRYEIISHYAKRADCTISEAEEYFTSAIRCLFDADKWIHACLIESQYAKGVYSNKKAIDIQKAASSMISNITTTTKISQKNDLSSFNRYQMIVNMCGNRMSIIFKVSLPDKFKEFERAINDIISKRPHYDDHAIKRACVRKMTSVSNLNETDDISLVPDDTEIRFIDLNFPQFIATDKNGTSKRFSIPRVAVIDLTNMEKKLTLDAVSRYIREKSGLSSEELDELGGFIKITNTSNGIGYRYSAMIDPKFKPADLVCEDTLMNNKIEEAIKNYFKKCDDKIHRRLSHRLFFSDWKSALLIDALPMNMVVTTTVKPLDGMRATADITFREG